jgi:hypothetical protein
VGILDAVIFSAAKPPPALTLGHPLIEIELLPVYRQSRN